MQNLNTKEMMEKGVTVLNVSEMPQENISVEKGQNYLLVGDNSVWLKKIPDNSIDSIVTDPPAGISFMGRGWDSDKGGRDSWIAWMCEVATECKRVLKPGGHAFVWAIPRTSHWTATAWENAGFEIRDVVAHVFGSGFPKSHNVEKAIQKIDKEKSKEFKGIGTALKPAREDWILIRKPLECKSVAENCLKYGTGGINIDESRVEAEPELSKNWDRKAKAGFGNGLLKGGLQTEGFKENAPTGRFPANLIHDNSEEVRECFPETAKSKSGGKGKPLLLGEGVKDDSTIQERGGYDDNGGNASRFFKSILYYPKASKSERNKGCEELEEKVGIRTNAPRENEDIKTPTRTNNHPTVKPIALMEYLIKMVTPKGGTVLDPFAGSGSTGVACKKNGYSFIGIEMEEDYIKIAQARINAVENIL